MLRLALGAGLVVLASQDDQAGAFTDVTRDALPGVEVVCGTPAKRWIVEVNGGGVGLEDLDGDGALDLVVVDGSTLENLQSKAPGRPPRVFLGDGAGAFRAAGEAWTLPAGRWGTGLAFGDVDNDGWTDLLVTGLDEVRLFVNRGGEGLVERTAGSGLPQAGWFTSAAFLDHDRDGVLDLFLARYLVFDAQRPPAHGADGATWKGAPVMAGPEGLEPQGDLLLRGLGGGRFEDVTRRAGLDAVAPAFGLGVVAQDLDADGDTDLYVANDSMPNHLWRNDGEGAFEEVGFAAGVGHGAEGREQAGMGVACADLTGDGAPELFVTNFSGEPNAYYESSQRRAGRWRERSVRAGVHGPSLHRLGWGTGALDLELDGDLDLFVLNGHVYPEADRPGTDTSYAQPDELYLRGGGRFEVLPLRASGLRPSRAGVTGDLDGDGDEDLVTLPVEGAVQVLRNDFAARGTWLQVRPRPRDGRSPLGTIVRLEWEGGSATREVTSSAGFQAARAALAHFALPLGLERAQLTIRWPDGASTTQPVEAFGRTLAVEQAP